MADNTNQPNGQNVEMKMPQESVATPGTPQQPPTAPTPPGGQPPAPEKKHPWIPITLGILIVILVLVLGGLYLWGARLVNQPPADQGAMTDETSSSTDAMNGDAGASQNTTADDLNAIEADLNSQDLSDIDTSLGAIDAELQATTSAQ